MCSIGSQMKSTSHCSQLLGVFKLIKSQIRFPSAAALLLGVSFGALLQIFWIATSFWITWLCMCALLFLHLRFSVWNSDPAPPRHPPSFPEEPKFKQARAKKRPLFNDDGTKPKKNALVSLNTTRFTTHFGEHCLVIPFCGCFCGFSSSVPAPRPSRRRRTKNENLQAKESDSAHKKGGKNTKTQRKKPKLPNNLGGAMRWKRKWLVVS